ncbi:hypothetical protein [Burkholderia gladioli]|uniref:hypothetical protein n=1 Tax=Burkholderia gladioli TaxID=28095 RepID=UPI001C5D54E0|nr:hypothetical protein [Burkholderia gladioli]MBW5284090.1 hypothetical protein [Burkholderia gladioli]
MIKQSFDPVPVADQDIPAVRTVQRRASGGIEPKVISRTSRMACLFETNRAEFGQGRGERAHYEGENIRARRNGNAMYKLEMSTISDTDARIFGFGELYVIPKTPGTPRSVPDLKGWLNDPTDSFHYEISARWATTRNGDTYLRMWMQKMDGLVRPL